MSKLKVNELDTKTGTTLTVTTGKTLDIPAGGTITVAGTQTVTGTANLTGATLTLPATLPATSAANLTNIPGANITGTIPSAALGNVDTSSLEDDIAILGFKVAANGSLAKYNLDDQTVDAFEDASGVDASASTNESRDSSGKYYAGATFGSYIYSAQTSTGAGTWTAPTSVTEVEAVIVAGGGGGGSGPATDNESGGGGGGRGWKGAGHAG